VWQVKLRLTKTLVIGVVVLSVVAQTVYIITTFAVASFGDRSITLSDNRAGSTGQFVLGLNTLGQGTVGSVKLEFCSSGAVPGTPCTPPTGFNSQTAVLAGQSGVADFSKLPATSDNVIGITRLPSSVANIPVTYTFTHILNPASNGTYFLRVYTYPTNDTTGAYTTAGGLAFSITNAVSVNATVPPYLTFCTGITIPILDCASAQGSYVNFGELSSGHANTGQAQMLTATNAENGYSVTVAGTTLTSGNNIIDASATQSTSTVGKPQFGLNLRANNTPFVGLDPDGLGVGSPTAGYGSPDRYKFVSGDVVAMALQPDLFKRYTISYVVNVPKTQSPGDYVTTLTYICLANF
jgi:hypothetical protein